MTSIVTNPFEKLGHLLSDAYGQNASSINVPDTLEPKSQADAYLAQRAFLNRRQLEIGGWKIGSKSEDGPIQGAPLPLRGIHPSSAVLPRERFGVMAIELEIMFCFDFDLVPGTPSLTDNDLVAGISSMAASIEIVSSRLTGWPDVPKLSQLADLQNHGALIAGEIVEYDKNFNFRHPQAHLSFNGQEIFKGLGNNPAGDPRRLLGWLIKHCTEQQIALPAGTLITTGTYTGMYFPKESGTVVGRIEGLPPVQFEIC